MQRILLENKSLLLRARRIGSFDRHLQDPICRLSKGRMSMHEAL